MIFQFLHKINFILISMSFSIIINRQLVSYIKKVYIKLLYLFSIINILFPEKKKKRNSHKPSLLNPLDWKTIPFTFANSSRNLNLLPHYTQYRYHTSRIAIKRRSKHPGRDPTWRGELQVRSSSTRRRRTYS